MLRCCSGRSSLDVRRAQGAFQWCAVEFLGRCEACRVGAVTAVRSVHVRGGLTGAAQRHGGSTPAPALVEQNRVPGSSPSHSCRSRITGRSGDARRRHDRRARAGLIRSACDGVGAAESKPLTPITHAEAVIRRRRRRYDGAVSDTASRGSLPLTEELAAIRRRCAALPVLDTRSAEEIIGYDEVGLLR